MLISGWQAFLLWAATTIAPFSTIGICPIISFKNADYSPFGSQGYPGAHEILVDFYVEAAKMGRVQIRIWGLDAPSIPG
jgi:hypothetical protein